MDRLHSVSIIPDLCVGCTNCIKGCPTEAIRVRDGKAVIDDIRCIDCSECIRICPYHAKYAKTDNYEAVFQNRKKLKVVAVVSPVLYTQFARPVSRFAVLAAVKSLGFDYVYEESIAYASYLDSIKAQILEAGEATSHLSSDETMDILPLVSSTCPVVVRLIQMKYRTIIPRLIQLVPPMESVASFARQELEADGIDASLIRVVYFSPCPARNTQKAFPLGIAKSSVDLVISVHEVYSRIVRTIEDINVGEAVGHDSTIRCSESVYLSCAAIGGESESVGVSQFLTVDGIKNVMDILNEIESEHLEGISFVEPFACFGGCVGGPMTVMNRFTATSRLREIAFEKIPESAQDCIDQDKIFSKKWSEELPDNKAMQLSDDIVQAMSKYDQIDQLLSILPGLDCGACGAPSCAAMAEDIVQGRADFSDCIILRKGDK
ncbi:MAG: 4Fe-4S dicluster domain-containing protein [Clostridiaceae bacterium]|nr:4Fe-4S dicluster domain-containing protein [Clostridiaceae bacterium]